MDGRGTRCSSFYRVKKNEAFLHEIVKHPPPPPYMSLSPDGTIAVREQTTTPSYSQDNTTLSLAMGSFEGKSI